MSFYDRLVRVNHRLISETRKGDRQFEAVFDFIGTPEQIKDLIDELWAIAGKLDVEPRQIP